MGYSITGPNGKTIYIRLLASNPYLSVRSNWACVSISHTEGYIDQEAYNTHYYNEPQSASLTFEEKTLKVSYDSFCLHKKLISLQLTANIGQADRATATYVLTYVWRITIDGMSWLSFYRFEFGYVAAAASGVGH